MTESELEKRNGKSNGLKVFPVDYNYYLVESSSGKICYKVSNGNGNGNSCTCADFVNRSPQDKEFVCKHILAVKNGNGNIVQIPSSKSLKPKLDDRFLTSIKGKDFVVYSGLLDLAHQIGIDSIDIEVIQYPNKENGMEAICKATVEAKTGESYVEWGDANPKNVNSMVREHILRIAATRSKARAFRDMTNIGITCLEELGDVENIEVDSDKSKNTKKVKQDSKSETKADVKQEKKPETEVNKANVQQSNTNSDKKPETKAPEKNKTEPKKDQNATTQKEKPKMSQAQKNAIYNLSKRRGISEDDIEKMAQETFNLSIDYLSTQDASVLIRNLQQAA